MTLANRLFGGTRLLLCATGLLGTLSVSAQTGSDESAAARVLNASAYSIRASEELSAFVNTTAEAAIEEHCAGCHGTDLTGQLGVPDLTDYDWLWGITGFELNDGEPVMALQQTLLYGIRNMDCPDIADVSYYGGCADTRYSEMPGYAALGFDEQQLSDLVDYTLDLSGAEADAEAVARTAELRPLCTECHGENGEGYKPYGGPDLTDNVWLYGDDRATILDVITNGRLGACPPWGYELDAATIKSLAVYIWNKAQGY